MVGGTKKNRFGEASVIRGVGIIYSMGPRLVQPFSIYTGRTSGSFINLSSWQLYFSFFGGSFLIGFVLYCTVSLAHSSTVYYKIIGA